MTTGEWFFYGFCLCFAIYGLLVSHYGSKTKDNRK